MLYRVARIPFFAAIRNPGSLPMTEASHAHTTISPISEGAKGRRGEGIEHGHPFFQPKSHLALGQRIVF